MRATPSSSTAPRVVVAGLGCPRPSAGRGRRSPAASRVAARAMRNPLPPRGIVAGIGEIGEIGVTAMRED